MGSIADIYKVDPSHAALLIDELRVLGNAFYKEKDCWRAITTYEAGLAMLGFSHGPVVKKDQKARHTINDLPVITKEVVESMDPKAMLSATTFYLNIAQSYLQLAQLSYLDPVTAGHVIMTVGCSMQSSLLSTEANKLCPKNYCILCCRYVAKLGLSLTALLKINYTWTALCQK